MKSKIIFNSKSHTYTSGKKIQYSSVSSLIGKYKQPYNAEYWSLYKTYERVLGDKFKDLKRGYKLQDSSLFKHLRNFADEQKVLKTQIEILKEWKGEKDKSIIKGNEYHTFKENQAISSGVCLNPFSDCNYPTVESTKITVKNKVEYREPTVDELYDLVDGFHPELILWNNDYKLAGQADKVFIETINGVRYAEIDDYKTNKAIKKANFFGKMLDPLGHLDCCNYNHYRLQISTYAWMLEQAGYTIRNTAFTHLNQQYKFDYMKHEVQLMLNIDPYLKLI